MPETILVQAAPGRRVRLPDGRVLQGEHEPVSLTRDLFVERRLADGDLVIVPPPSAEVEEA